MANYVYLPPGPIYVQLPPGIEQLYFLLRESHVTQRAMHREQQEFARGTRELGSTLERNVDDRRVQLQRIHDRLDHLTNLASTLLAIQIHRRESGSPESVFDQRPAPAPVQPPVRMPMPVPPQRYYRPVPMHPVVFSVAPFDAPPVIPTPVQPPKPLVRSRWR